VRLMCRAEEVTARCMPIYAIRRLVYGGPGSQRGPQKTIQKEKVRGWGRIKRLGGYDGNLFGRGVKAGLWFGSIWGRGAPSQTSGSWIGPQSSDRRRSPGGGMGKKRWPGISGAGTACGPRREDPQWGAAWRRTWGLGVASRAGCQWLGCAVWWGRTGAGSGISCGSRDSTRRLGCRGWDLAEAALLLWSQAGHRGVLGHQ